MVADALDPSAHVTVSWFGVIVVVPLEEIGAAETLNAEKATSAATPIAVTIFLSIHSPLLLNICSPLKRSRINV
jgi:hypothetical protein